jgi:hypothetical protein
MKYLSPIYDKARQERRNEIRKLIKQLQQLKRRHTVATTGAATTPTTAMTTVDTSLSSSSTTLDTTSARTDSHNLNDDEKRKKTNDVPIEDTADADEKMMESLNVRLKHLQKHRIPIPINKQIWDACSGVEVKRIRSLLESAVEQQQSPAPPIKEKAPSLTSNNAPIIMSATVSPLSSATLSQSTIDNKAASRRKASVIPNPNNDDPTTLNVHLINGGRTLLDHLLLCYQKAYTVHLSYSTRCQRRIQHETDLRELLQLLLRLMTTRPPPTPSHYMYDNHDNDNENENDGVPRQRIHRFNLLVYVLANCTAPIIHLLLRKLPWLFSNSFQDSPSRALMSIYRPARRRSSSQFDQSYYMRYGPDLHDDVVVEFTRLIILQGINPSKAPAEDHVGTLALVTIVIRRHLLSIIIIDTKHRDIQMQLPRVDSVLALPFEFNHQSVVQFSMMIMIVMLESIVDMSMLMRIIMSRPRSLILHGLCR